MTPITLPRFQTAALLTTLAVGGAFAAQTPTPSRLPMSISGRIVSATTGRPIPNARANVSIADYGVATTIDADGRFVATIREPGLHRVSASAPGYVTRAFGDQPEIGATRVAVRNGQAVQGIDIALHRGATIAGVVTDDAKDPFVSGTVRAFAKRVQYGEVRYQLASETKTDDRGSYRLTGLAPGEYVVGAIESSVVTLAPSVATPATATTITLAEDAERDGVNVQLRAVKTGAVEGSVTGPGTGSPRLVVQLVPDLISGVTNTNQFAAQVTGGRFAFFDVPAGPYRLIVAPGLGGQPPRAWALAPVVVAAGNTTQARVTVSDEPRISGTVESVGLRQLTIRLTAIGGDRPEAPTNSVGTPAQGPFSIGAVAPGRYHLQTPISEMSDVLLSHKRPRVDDPGVHRLISSIFVKDEDVSDRVFVVAPNTSIGNIRVLVTETGARITGTVVDAAGAPTTTGAVVVFPIDPRDWTVVSRRIRVTRADTDGVYHVPLLPPGRYRVAHVMSLAPGQLSDPAFLKTLSSAQEIDAAAGSVATVQLRLK